MAKRKQYDERIISAFLTNYRMTDIVRETGLSKNTAYKYKRDPEFQKVIQERKTAILQTAVNRMSSYMVKNVETLQAIAEDPEVNPAVRVSAINTIMTQLRGWLTTTELSERLTALEEAAKGRF